MAELPILLFFHSHNNRPVLEITGCEMKLLIVEDNFQMRRLIKSIVEDIAESISECEDGNEALSAYSQFQPDWVLMDIKMAKVDGITATREIRKAFPGAKVVIITNFDDAKFRLAAREAGASYYVSKENLTDVRAVLLQQGTARISAL